MGLANSSASIISQPLNSPALPGNGSRSDGRSANGASNGSSFPGQFYDFDDNSTPVDQNGNPISPSSGPLSFPDTNLSGLFENSFYSGPNNIFNLNRGPFITSIAGGGGGGGFGGGSGSADGSDTGSSSFSSRFNSAQNNPFNRTFGNLGSSSSRDRDSDSTAA